MKKKFINMAMKIINKHNTNYSATKMEEIKYGLEGVYILVTKTILIFTVAYFLNLATELLIFILVYNLIRMPSFGLHATTSSICLFSSYFIFLLAPYACKIIDLSLLLKAVIGITCILLIFKNAPADTYKRPIINVRRREIYKFISTLIAISFTFLAVVSVSTFLSNIFIIALVVQCFMISPMTYKIFNLPYNNYKKYIIHNSI